MRQVAIINYNTPELTEAAILSLRKHMSEDCQVTVFDNSDRRPFKKRMKGARRIDNTKGKVIDFGKFLAEFPDREPRFARLSDFGSAKHMRTVQELFSIIPEGFVLMESDVLIRKDIAWMWEEQYAAVGTIQWRQPGNRLGIPRLLPWLCYLNVPLLTANGARYFDPSRSWALQKGEMTRGNWYDTGAALLEDIRRTKPQLVCHCPARVEDCYIHYGGGSWRDNDREAQLSWLEKHEALWK